MKPRQRILKMVLASMLVITADLTLNTEKAHAAEPATLTKSQSFMESEGSDSVKWPDTITDEKGVWKLVRVDDPTIDPNWTRPTEVKTITKSLTIDAGQTSTANGLFENTITYNSAGWEGTLTKAGVDLQPEYEVCTRQVDKLVTLEGLETNDVTQLPQTKKFEVSTAESLNSTGMVELALSDVAWVVTKTDELGVPVEFSASCNYRGIEEYLTIPAYTLTCTWTGEALQADTQMISTAVYELESSFPWLAIAAVAIAAACIAITAYFRTRSAGCASLPQEA